VPPATCETEGIVGQVTAIPINHHREKAGLDKNAHFPLAAFYASINFMRFIDSKVSREHRYSLGTDSASGRPYLSIPVRNRAVDYEEFYLLTDAEYNSFTADPMLAAKFAARCGCRALDERLIIAPGPDRGSR